jgi:hypothetical protein
MKYTLIRGFLTTVPGYKVHVARKTYTGISLKLVT